MMQNLFLNSLDFALVASVIFVASRGFSLIL